MAEDGSLIFAFETGTMSESAPVAWQEIGGKKIPVTVSFVRLSAYDIGFSIGKYSPEYPLIIDPVITWNTFMGGTSEDYARAIAVDGSGNLVVAGYSNAAWGSPVNAHAGGADAFAAKLNSSGVLQWHTFMGGTGSDTGYAIAVDGSGNIVVAGESTATWGSPINPHAGGYDAFAAKLDSSGNRLWHTFMGGTADDIGYAIAVDGSGNVFVAGDSSCRMGFSGQPPCGELGRVCRQTGQQRSSPVAYLHRRY